MLLSQNRMTPETFEAMQQEAMLIDKLKAIVTSCVKVTDEEAEQWYTWDNASETINYALFSPESFKNVEVSDAMINEYYNAHKDSYKTEPSRKVRYLKFDPALYREKTNVTEDEIQQYYTDHEDEFNIAETISGRQILLKTPENAAPEEVEKIKQEALTILEKAKAGEDFAELAKKYSESPEKENGGAIGPLSRDKMPPEIADKIFSMEAGQISDPIQTKFGWLIFKLESKNPAATSPLQEVSDKIRAKITDQKSKNMAYDDAASLYDSSLNGEDLAKNAAQKKLNMVTTDFFTKSKGPADMKAPAEFAKIAFELPAMQVSDVTEIGDSYYLIQVIEEQAEQIPALDAVKDKVREDVAREEEAKAAENAAKKFLEQARGKGSLTMAAAGAGVEVKTVDLANRHSSPPPEFGNDALSPEAAFLLSEKNKFPDHPIKGEKGYYVIELKEKKQPPPEGYKTVRSAIIQRLINQKQTELFKEWIADLRKNSKISISDKMLNRT